MFFCVDNFISLCYTDGDGNCDTIQERGGFQITGFNGQIGKIVSFPSVLMEKIQKGDFPAENRVTNNEKIVYHSDCNSCDSDLPFRFPHKHRSGVFRPHSGRNLLSFEFCGRKSHGH